MRGLPWTPQDDRWLMQFRSNGSDWPDIGRAIGRSAESVRVRYYKIWRRYIPKSDPFAALPVAAAEPIQPVVPWATLATWARKHKKKLKGPRIECARKVNELRRMRGEPVFWVKADDLEGCA